MYMCAHFEIYNTMSSSKLRFTSLFRRTESYHRKQLRVMFREHYNPLLTNWTENLSQQVIDDLRLHLSWELGINTFTWTRAEVGDRITDRHQTLGILLFMINVIKNDKRIK